MRCDADRDTATTTDQTGQSWSSENMRGSLGRPGTTLSLSQLSVETQTTSHQVGPVWREGHWMNREIKKTRHSHTYFILWSKHKNSPTLSTVADYLLNHRKSFEMPFSDRFVQLLNIRKWFSIFWFITSILQLYKLPYIKWLPIFIKKLNNKI